MVNSGIGLKLCAALIALACVAASTGAIADGPASDKQPPLSVAATIDPWTWTGVYAGGYVGRAFGSVSSTDIGYNKVFYNEGGANPSTQSGVTAGALGGISLKGCCRSNLTD